MAHETRPLPKLVLFDVGNVLIQLRPWPGLVPEEVAGKRSPEELESTLREFLTSDLLGRYETGQLETADFFDGVRSFFGFELEDVELERRFLSILGDPMPGMTELIRSLKTSGVRAAGLSDTSAVHVAHLGRYEAVAELELLLASCEIGRKKPHPQTFLYAVERLGVSPGDVFFTDDNTANVEGAREAGLHAELFCGAEKLRQSLGMKPAG